MEYKLKKYTLGDTNIWILVLMLCLASIPLVYSTTNSLDIQGKSSNTVSLLKQIFFIGLGLLTIYFSHKVNYRIYARIGVLMFWLSIPLLIYTYLFGISINNAYRWIGIPGTGLTIQTSEIAKTALIMYLCKYLANNQATITSWKNGFIPAIIPVLIMVALIVPANLSTGMFVFFIAIVVLYIGRAKISHLLAVCGVASIPIVLLVSWVMVAHHQDWKANVFPVGRVNVWINRVDDFLYAKEDTEQYQVQQSKIALAKGGFFGVGPGNSTQKNFLPSAFSDYIFSMVVEEYGLLGASAIIIIYLLLGFRAIQVFRKCPYAFGALLSVALSFELLLSALFNVAVNAGLLPVTGVTLPFISRGGTSFIMTCLQIGMILSVSQSVEKPKIEPTTEEQKEEQVATA